MTAFYTRTSNEIEKPHETNMAEEEFTFETSPLMIRLEQGVNKVYRPLIQTC